MKRILFIFCLAMIVSGSASAQSGVDVSKLIDSVAFRASDSALVFYTVGERVAGVRVPDSIVVYATVGGGSGSGLGYKIYDTDGDTWIDVELASDTDRVIMASGGNIFFRGDSAGVTLLAPTRVNGDLSVLALGGDTVLYVDTVTNRVGLRTGTPLYTLHVKDVTTEPLIVCENNGGNGGAGFMFIDGLTNVSWKMKSTGLGSFRLRENVRGVNAIEIDTVGRVGVGTTTPVNKLDVEGAVVIGAGYSGTSTAPTNGLLVEGSVAIGSASAGEALDVTGDVEATGYFLPSMAYNLTASADKGAPKQLTNEINVITLSDGADTGFVALPSPPTSYTTNSVHIYVLNTTDTVITVLPSGGGTIDFEGTVYDEATGTTIPAQGTQSFLLIGNKSWRKFDE